MESIAKARSARVEMSKCGGFYWVECWVQELGDWAANTAHWTKQAACSDADRRHRTHKRDYRVTQYTKAGQYVEIARYTTEPTS